MAPPHPRPRPRALTSALCCALLALASLGPAAVHAACCNAAEVLGVCYGDLGTAVSKAEGGPITVAGTVAVKKPITVPGDLDIRGDSSCGGRPKIVADFHRTEEGIFMLDGDVVTITLKGPLTLAPKAKETFSSAIRANSAFSEVSLDIQNVIFDGFRNDINGSAIYIGRAGNVDIGSGSQFKDCVQAEPGEGGGTLYIQYVPKGTTMYVDADFTDNTCLYSHCEGAAIYVETIKGKVEISGTYARNSAPDGAALHLRNIQGGATAIVDGNFNHNIADDRGEGNRGGAVRTLSLSGNLILRGKFRANESPDGRGGVIALNNIRENGVLTLSGEFIDNSVGKGNGGVVSASWTFDGKMVIDADAVFQGNQAASSSTLYYFQPCSSPAELCKTLAMKESEANYNRLPRQTRTITYDGPDVQKAIEEYKANLAQTYGANESAQRLGLWRKYGRQWTDFFVSTKDMRQLQQEVEADIDAELAEADATQ